MRSAPVGHYARNQGMPPASPPQAVAMEFGNEGDLKSLKN